MEIIKTDLLVIGAGAAGVSAVFTAQRLEKTILWVNKGRFLQSGSTFVNCNGRWGVTYAETDREKEDLLTAVNSISVGTNNIGLSEVLVENSSLALRMLCDLGVQFCCTDDGQAVKASPCFYSQPAATLIQDCSQMAEMVSHLLDRSVVTVLEQFRVVELIRDNQRCTGCLGVSSAGEELRVKAQATILATGGRAASYEPNIVEPGLTGDGFRLLREIGVDLKNMAYMQRVWECCDRQKKRFPVSCLWNEKYLFETAAGKPISLPDKESEIMQKRKQHVLIANLQKDKMVDQLLLENIPLLDDCHAIQVFDKKTGKKMYEILPHVQAGNGGVEIGKHGETGVERLYAAGEVTTGMHGGDRIGGMMITSALVFGARAARAAVARMGNRFGN